MITVLASIFEIKVGVTCKYKILQSSISNKAWDEEHGDENIPNLNMLSNKFKSKHFGKDVIIDDYQHWKA